MILKNQAQITAQIGECPPFECRDVLSVDDYTAGIGVFNGGNEIKQGAFACAGMPGNKYHFAHGDVETDVFQCFVAAGKALVNLIKTNHSPSPAMR